MLIERNSQAPSAWLKLWDFYFREREEKLTYWKGSDGSVEGEWKVKKMNRREFADFALNACNGVVLLRKTMFIALYEQQSCAGLDMLRYW